VVTGVETGHLGQRRKGLLEDAQALQVVRLVQRRQRLQLRQGLQHVGRDEDAVAKGRAAVHHAVGHGLQRRCAGQVGEQGLQLLQRGVKGLLARRQGQLLVLALPGPQQPGGAAGLQALDAPGEPTFEHLRALARVQRKLQRR
jgi:hypothetical protein